MSFRPSVIDLRGLPSAAMAIDEMLTATAINPMEHVDRLFYGEVSGVFRRFAGATMVLVVAGLSW